MSPAANAILAELEGVAGERRRLAADAALAARVHAVKAFQHHRFEATYADLLHEPGTAAAAEFFLDDLYGTRDFSSRDAQFARIVPALDRLFPKPIVETVLELAQLHGLSERLDRRMGEAVEALGATTGSEREPLTLSAALYVAAWRAVGETAARERQITLMLDVGKALIAYTRNPFLRQSLKLMRGPARLAGLDALHRFLERGFDTFRGLREPRAFLDTVAARERALAAQLFAG